MRLTTDLIQSSLSFLNPLRERELDLRGHKIPQIENLAAAGPQDALDLTDNDITHLANFPLSPRLQTLLLARNRITGIAANLANSLPNLSVVVLTQNNLKELADLDPLGACAKLVFLSVAENPVARKEHYRSYLIHRIPSLRILDFSKIRAVERERAKELFGTLDNPSELAVKISGIKSRSAASGAGGTTNGNGNGTFDASDSSTLAGSGLGSGAGKTYRVKLTEKEKKRVEGLIRNAKSLAEISRLERELNEGRIPGGVLGEGNEDDED